MKRILSSAISLLSVTALVLLSASCKKKNIDQPNQLLTGTTFWECNMIVLNPDTTRYFYLFTLSQDADRLSGEVSVLDTAGLINGTISGTVRQDSLFFSTDLPGGEFNFSFRGAQEDLSGQSHLSGTLASGLLAGNGNEDLPVWITPSDDFRLSDVFPTNPYLFRKVNSSEHPGDSAVIFIHGMTGDLTHWDGVVGQLTDDFKKRHDVYLFQYNWKDSIGINGRILLDSVIAAGLTHPILVAHSMGGLVARSYVAQGGEVARLVALGTPHLGSPLAKLTGVIAFLDFPGPRDMKPEGPFIQNLLSNPSDVTNRNRYVVFGGQMKGSFKIVNKRIKWVWAETYYDVVDKIGYNAFVLFLSPPNDGLVPVSSGLFDGYTILERKPILEWVDHKNLRTPSISIQVMDYINSL